MFTTRSRNLILALIATVVLIALAALLLLKPGQHIVLAQGGGDDNKSEAGDVAPGDLGVTPVEEGGIGPLSDGSGVEVVPLAAFKHDGNNANGWFHSFFDDYIRNNSDVSACFVAPTYPPDGATLDAFAFSLTDDSASSDLSVYLHRVRLSTGATDIIAGGALTGRDSSSPTEAAGSVAGDKNVVSKDYAYYVTLCFDPDTGFEILFYGARVFYTPATP